MLNIRSKGRASTSGFGRVEWLVSSAIEGNLTLDTADMICETDEQTNVSNVKSAGEPEYYIIF